VSQLPSLTHRRNLETRNFFDDPYQSAILPQLDQLYWYLLDAHKNHRPASVWQRWSHPLKSRETKINSIYLWGSVGRGKTYLMDLLYESLPFEGKKRVHFHRFMIGIHDRLKEPDQKTNKVEEIALSLAKNFRILCLDELSINDIGDAVIFERLLSALNKNNVIMVITSNTAPDELYQDGLHRQRFTPAIELIKNNMLVLQLSGGRDHRIAKNDGAGVYLVPHDCVVENQIAKLFWDISGESGALETTIPINGRLVSVRGKGSGIVWFDFEVICAGYYSKVDFAAISSIYHTVILTNIPILRSHNDDETRRFVELIDELYDHRVNLIVSAASRPEELYDGDKMDQGFRRAISRLHEFQSSAYISQPHRP